MKESKLFIIFLITLLDSLNFILILKADVSILWKIVFYVVAIFMTGYCLSEDEEDWNEDEQRV